MALWNKRHDDAVAKNPVVRGMIATTVGYPEFENFNYKMDFEHRRNDAEDDEVSETEVDGYITDLKELHEEQVEYRLRSIAMDAAGICALTDDPEGNASIFQDHFASQFYIYSHNKNRNVKIAVDTAKRHFADEFEKKARSKRARRPNQA